MNKSLSAALMPIAIIALCSTSMVNAQERDKQSPQPHSRVKKLSEWPAIKKPVGDRARSLTKQYRKRKVELHVEATRKLSQIGASVAPILIPLVNDRAESINEHLFEVLDAVITKEHAALLAREAHRPSVNWRRYLLRKLAGFHDADMAPVFTRALKDKDPDIAFYAGLGLLSLGKHDGLQIVMLAAKQRWAEFKTLIAEVLPAARSEKCAERIFTDITSARPTDQMAGLRLLRYLMVKDQSVLLRHYLEATDFTVKREAINTARVLHGQEPLDKLASFQAINMAKEWLNKL